MNQFESCGTRSVLNSCALTLWGVFRCDLARIEMGKEAVEAGALARANPLEVLVFTHLLPSKSGLTQKSSLKPLSAKTGPSLEKNVPTK